MGLCFSVAKQAVKQEEPVRFEEMMHVLDAHTACCYGSCFGTCTGCCARKRKYRVELTGTYIIWRSKDGTQIGKCSLFGTGFDLEMAMDDNDEINKESPSNNLYIRIMPRQITLFPPSLESKKKWVEGIRQNQEIGSSSVQGISSRAEVRAKESLATVLDSKLVRAGVSAGVTVGAGLVAGPVAAMAAPAIADAGLRGLKQELGLNKFS